MHLHRRVNCVFARFLYLLMKCVVPHSHFTDVQTNMTCEETEEELEKLDEEIRKQAHLQGALGSFSLTYSQREIRVSS
jgi:hypothetical protein